ncbi:hypothetical protein BSKO_09196 [Bryopsis sp. KO-2023]|nr:hypothetical protein BSKO_09196 [Bryopsis sp. KO-2023]
MNIPTILVVGGEGVGKNSLSNRLLGVDGSSVEENQRAVWEIDTKYYTASAEIVTVSLDESVGRDAEPEAVVLVVDVEKESTYLKLREWWASNLSSRSWQIGLVVANKVDQVLDADGRPGWLTSVEEWAASEMLEYVESSATNETVDCALEGQGITRVRDALHAHTWPGLTLKTRPNGGAAPTTPISENVPQWEDRVADGDMSTRSLEEDGWVLFPTENGNERLGNGCTDVEPPSRPTALEEEGLGVADDFDRLLANVVGARDRLQNLPDSQRREEAARIAMQLAQFIDMSHSETSGSDDN